MEDVGAIAQQGRSGRRNRRRPGDRFGVIGDGGRRDRDRRRAWYGGGRRIGRGGATRGLSRIYGATVRAPARHRPAHAAVERVVAHDCCHRRSGFNRDRRRGRSAECDRNRRGRRRAAGSQPGERKERRRDCKVTNKINLGHRPVLPVLTLRIAWRPLPKLLRSLPTSAIFSRRFGTSRAHEAHVVRDANVKGSALPGSPAGSTIGRERLRDVDCQAHHVTVNAEDISLAALEFKLLVTRSSSAAIKRNSASAIASAKAPGAENATHPNLPGGLRSRAHDRATCAQS
jgi:hypothetical protein